MINFFEWIVNIRSIYIRYFCSLRFNVQWTVPHITIENISTIRNVKWCSHLYVDMLYSIKCFSASLCTGTHTHPLFVCICVCIHYSFRYVTAAVCVCWQMLNEMMFTKKGRWVFMCSSYYFFLLCVHHPTLPSKQSRLCVYACLYLFFSFN